MEKYNCPIKNKPPCSFLNYINENDCCIYNNEEYNYTTNDSLTNRLFWKNLVKFDNLTNMFINFKFNDDQKMELRYYSDQANYILFHYLINNFSISSQLLTYLNKESEYYKYFSDKDNEILKFLNNFYYSLKSCIVQSIDKPFIVYRGISFKYNFTINTFVRINNFVSTSLDYGVAQRFSKGETIMIIFIPPNTNFCQLNNNTNFEESEILLDSGSVFYVIKKNLLNVFLVYVGNESIVNPNRQILTTDELQFLDLNVMLNEYIKEDNIKEILEIIKLPYFTLKISTITEIIMKIKDNNELINKYKDVFKKIIKIFGNNLSNFPLISYFIKNKYPNIKEDEENDEDEDEEIDEKILIETRTQENQITFMIFNIYNYTFLRDDNKIKKLNNIINKYLPELLLLQEDIGSSNDLLYTTIVKCKTNKNLYNSILLRNDIPISLFNNPKTLLLESSFNNESRCMSMITYKNIKIANIHLSGGKYDDINFIENIDLRNRQIKEIIKLNPDIIAGDFNSSPDKFPKNYDLYDKLSDSDKLLFEKYFISGHQPLIDSGYIKADVSFPTDSFNGNPDHIYYNPKKIKNITTEVINMLSTNLSDHNAVFIKITF